MDPVESVNTVKDSTYAMLREAQKRRWGIEYMEMNDLYLSDGVARARTRRLEFRFDREPWYGLSEVNDTDLSQLDAILMRKDPPFDTEYIYSSYILERAEIGGALVVNKPQALRDANEKMFTAWFPQCAPPTLVTREYQDIRAFMDQHGDTILKPLEGMGGASVFRVSASDPNLSVIMEDLTRHQTRYIMAQRFIEEITEGDKRVLMINGEPVPYALARVPAPGELRGNLAAGAKGVGKTLSERDLWICGQVGPVLKEKGIVFSGLDIIGDYLTEINVTSPTGIRELDRIYDENIAGKLLDAIEALIQNQ